ncbi:MAG: hypothetical protein ACI9VT_001043 [Psychroserpens sp.]|jgi:hypothetical protein
MQIKCQKDNKCQKGKKGKCNRQTVNEYLLVALMPKNKLNKLKIKMMH